MTIANEIIKLDTQRKALADNLVVKSVLANQSETLSELVPKVLQVPQEGGGLDTNDATAYAEHILEGYTAYARGQKIVGTFKLKSDELDMNVDYNILIISGTGNNADVAITKSELIIKGHHVVEQSLSTFISSDLNTTGYDIVFITNCADTNDKVFRTIYESCSNVLFGYFLEASSRNTAYDLGIANSNITNDSRRAGSFVPIEHAITLSYSKEINVNLMTSSNWGMVVEGVLVGTTLITTSPGNQESILIAIEAGEVSSLGIPFPRYTCLYGLTHGRGGYSVVGIEILDKIIRWIIQSNSQL